MRKARGAHTELPTFGLDQGGNWDTGRGERIVRRNRLHVLRRATRVVAVKTEPALCIELSIGPWAEDQTCFWLGQELGGRAGIELPKVDYRRPRQFVGNIRGSQA